MTPSSADTIPGEMIGQGIIVTPDGQPTIAGANNSCGASLISGCLVVGTPATSNFAPINVTDGFDLQTPVPSAWQGLEQTAEATIANLRGVPADRRNQYWARPEIDTLMFLDLIGLIHKRAAGGTLNAQEQGEVDLLSASYQDYEKKVADKALGLYHTWAGDPCSFRVPVGNNPDAYRETLGTACDSSATADTPPPTAEQFTEWARELVGEDFRRSLVPQVQRFAQVANAPAMTADEADAEIESEYQNAVGSLEKGLSFLIAAGHATQTAPAAEQPQATGELLNTLKEAAAQQALDRAPELFGNMIKSTVTLGNPLRAPLFGVEQLTAEQLSGLNDPGQFYETPIGPLEEAAQELEDLVAEAAEQQVLEGALTDGFEVGSELGGLVLGGAAAVVAESIQLAQDAEVQQTLQADQTAADAAPNLETLTQSSDGWAKLENAFVDELMPDFTFRKLRDPAPDGAAPAPSANDAVLHIRPLNGTDTIDSRTILTQDWARPGMLQAISVGNGWVTRAPLLGVASDPATPRPGAPTADDLLGPAVSDTSFNYIDSGGDWWRAWPVRGQLMQVRFAKPLGSVSVYRYLTDGIPGDIPCHDAPFGVGQQPTSNGFRCVVGDGTQFKTDLARGDFVILGDEIKQVDTVFSDTAFTTTTPFQARSSAVEPIDSGSSLMKIVSGDTNCWTDGNCKLGGTIEYQSRAGGLYTASIDNLPPVVALSITGALHNGPLRVEQTCDPQGNCNSASESTWAFAPGEQITLDPHAFSPEPDRYISEVDWLICPVPKPTPQSMCDREFNPLGPQDPQAYIFEFFEPGTWSVTIFARDTAGDSTAVQTRLTVRKADQAITPDGLTGTTYGAAPQSLAPTASSGLPVDVTSASPSVCTTSGAHGATITLVGVGQCQLDESQDGNLTYNAAPVVHETFDIGKAPLTVTADNETKPFGAPVPSLTATLSGFVNGENLATSGVSGSASCSTSATGASPSGSYPITCTQGSLTATNYAIATFVPGNLTINFSTTITGSHTGNLDVTAGQQLLLAPGSTVNGPVTVQPGGALEADGATITGPLSASQPTAVRLCHANVTGRTTVSDATGLVVLGDDDGTPACAGNQFHGPVKITNDTGGVEFDANAVTGPLTITGNTGTLPPPDSGSVDTAGNTVSGPSNIHNP